MLTDLSPDLLRPGSWTLVVQDALDTCARATTPADIVRDFGSARGLTEAMLGYPVSGGFATKPAIRAVGRLVTHRLGPALAAEALSWAACAAEVVDRTTIEAFLAMAADAPATYLPLRIADRSDLHGLLDTERTSKGRRELLFATWHRENDDQARTFWTCDGLVCELFEADADWHLDDHGMTGAALSPTLFDENDDVIARYLRDSTHLVLDNPACPAALKNLIRHPYDDRTLELALRAGPRHVDQDRLRIRLSRLDAEQLRALATRVPAHLLFALRAIGAVDAELFLSGPLRDVDLAAQHVLTAAFGRPYEWPNNRIPDDLVRLLEHHPRRAALAHLVASAPQGGIDEALALRLAATAPRPLAVAALQHVELTSLTTAHGRFGPDLPDQLRSQCPGIRAADRPVHPTGISSRTLPTTTPTRFIYPSELLELETAAFPSAPAWTMWLPRTHKDLERNALDMQNCTAGFAARIAGGGLAIVVVTAPDGSRYNVALHRQKSTWIIGEINGRYNNCDAPPWIRPSLLAHLRTQSMAPPDHDDTPLFARRSSDRRDRRRRRASAARRRR